jgi:hypothetical protein
MNVTPTPAGPARNSLQTRFVLVNDRVPRTDANCALCCAKIERGYVRDPQTRLVYCDPHCFTGHEKMAMAVIVSRSRRAS